MSWFKRAAIALALTLVLAACGSDDDTETDAGADAETSDGSSADDRDAMDDGDMDEDEDDAMDDGDESNDDDAMEEDDAMDDDDAMSDDEDAMDEDDAMSEDEDGDGGDDTPLAAASEAGNLAIVSIDFSTAEIQLTNTTDAELDINGWVMCNFPNYAPISGVDPIAPGETVTVTSTVAIPANDGELAIYIAEDFTNPASMVTYVEWGSDGHTRSSVASAAGIWDGPALSADGDILTVAG